MHTVLMLSCLAKSYQSILGHALSVCFMFLTAFALAVLTKAVRAAPLNLTRPTVLQTGQSATVTGYVPTAFPTLSYFALPGNDTVP